MEGRWSNISQNIPKLYENRARLDTTDQPIEVPVLWAPFMYAIHRWKSCKYPNRANTAISTAIFACYQGDSVPRCRCRHRATWEHRRTVSNEQPSTARLITCRTHWPRPGGSKCVSGAMGTNEGCEQMCVTEAHPLAGCCFSDDMNGHAVPVMVSLNAPGPLMGKPSILIHSPPKLGKRNLIVRNEDYWVFIVQCIPHICLDGLSSARATPVAPHLSFIKDRT